MECLDYDEMVESLEKIALELESKGEWSLSKDVELVKSSLIGFRMEFFELEESI